MWNSYLWSDGKLDKERKQDSVNTPISAKMNHTIEKGRCIINKEDNKNETQPNYGFYVRSVQASQLYQANAADPEEIADTQTLYYRKAAIGNSLFSKYVREHGVSVNKRGRSLDFVMMKFDYKYTDDTGNEKATKTLREECYENGITIPWKTYDKDGKVIETNSIRYQMLYRSPGKAKEGQCMFVRNDFLKNYRDFLTMGLWDKMLKENAKIVELSAYAPLITATALDFITIPIENIFVVRDKTASSKRSTYSVRYDAESEKCYVERNNKKSGKASNTLWDGMGLIDEEMFPDGMDGFIYCRSHFFKSCLFRGNLQEWFKDYYGKDYETAIVTDMFGREMNIKDIKVIVTENSLKWIKFKDIISSDASEASAFQYWEKWMKENHEEFQIVKTAHESKYGDMQRSSFQMINTLLTTDEKTLKNISLPSIEYCNELKKDVEAYVQFLELNRTDYSINGVLADLYYHNPQIQYWSWWKDQRTDKISDFKRNRLQQGRLFLVGDNLTICRNPIALLLAVCGKEPEDEKCFKLETNAIQCYTERFMKNKHIAGFRNPHNSPNNIVHLHNVYPATIRRYFPKLGRNVVIINGIGSDVQDRLNGQDLDTDSIFATTQKDIVELAKKAYKEHPTIINAIPQQSKDYTMDMKSFADMDNQISNGQIDVGTASNMAQLALSYWFDGSRKDKELEDVFIICSVLAQIAIDSAKRSFDVMVSKELRRLGNLDCMKHTPRYPKFYADILDYKDSKKKAQKAGLKAEQKREQRHDERGYMKCPMDVVHRLINKNVIDLTEHKELNTPTIHFASEFIDCEANTVNANRKQYRKIIDHVKEYDQKVSDFSASDEDYYENMISEFQELMDNLKRTKIQSNTMKGLVAYAFKTGKKESYNKKKARVSNSLRNHLLVTLYSMDEQKFLDCFVKSSQK